LSSLFSIELCAYAVMSNHYHLVVRLDPAEPASWTDDEVFNRWTALFRGPLLVQQYQSGDPVSPAELDTLQSIAAVYRTRLGSLSWFMKCLNEPIARQANAEDGCTGHFWEARFNSQPLCSERALLAAMAYVDLNPVRAGIADTPENSDYTSIKARLGDKQDQVSVRGAIARMLGRGELNHFEARLRPLMHFADETKSTNSEITMLPIKSHDYYRLVEATGRAVASGKMGRIDSRLAPILERLGVSGTDWTQASSAFRQHYRNGDLRTRQIA